MQPIIEPREDGGAGSGSKPPPTPIKPERKVKTWMIFAGVILLALIIAALT